MDAQCLGALLAPHAEYLSAHGVTLPLEGREAPLRIMALAQLLIAGDPGMPRELTDALYFIDEMATPNGIEFPMHRPLMIVSGPEPPTALAAAIERGVAKL